jgi:FixJ family two-component response regulator
MNKEPIVHIVDDDSAIRDSLELLLGTVGLDTKTYCSAEEFLNISQYSSNDCLIVDVRMPGMTGIELQRKLSQNDDNLPIIMITGHGDVAMAVEAMKEGAIDFLEKPINNTALIERIKHCMNITQTLHQKPISGLNAKARLARLSPRETEVMGMLIDGKLNKVIAAELGISVRTVEAHRAKIMKKLEARSLSDVVRLALSIQ